LKPTYPTYSPHPPWSSFPEEKKNRETFFSSKSVEVEDRGHVGRPCNRFRFDETSRCFFFTFLCFSLLTFSSPRTGATSLSRTTPRNNDIYYNNNTRHKIIIPDTEKNNKKTTFTHDSYSCRYPKRHYTEYHYVKCRRGECRGARISANIFVLLSLLSFPLLSRKLISLSQKCSPMLSRRGNIEKPSSRIPKVGLSPHLSRVLRLQGRFGKGNRF
jgi:hypothetical protein